MKKTLSFLCIVTLAAAVAHGAITVNFDTDTNWTAGSGSIGSYQNDHVYSESGVDFTGGRALRQTSGDQDGFPGALGTYAWRLDDGATSPWIATYTVALNASDSIASFGFDARRWDGSPSPAFTVEYTVNGGSNWSTASSIGSSGVLDNTAFGDSSAYSSFSQTVNSSTGLGANQFQVRFVDATGERIMVDNFSITVVPEPSTYAMLAGLVALGLILRRRMRT